MKRIIPAFVVLLALLLTGCPTTSGGVVLTPNSEADWAIEYNGKILASTDKPAFNYKLIRTTEKGGEYYLFTMFTKIDAGSIWFSLGFVVDEGFSPSTGVDFIAVMRVENAGGKTASDSWPASGSQKISANDADIKLLAAGGKITGLVFNAKKTITLSKNTNIKFIIPKGSTFMFPK